MGIVTHLVLTEPGLHVGKHSARLRVTRIKTGERVLDAPLVHLQSVLIASRGVSISSNAIHECVERGIPIYFVRGPGQPYGTLYSAHLVGTVETRRAQLRAYDDARGRTLALAFARGKIQNQQALLRYAARYRKEQAPQVYEEVLAAATAMRDALAELEALAQGPATTVDDLRGPLLAVEGRAAQHYWQGFGRLLPAEPPWPGRLGRGAQDPINRALNYGYGILYGVVERAALLAGLDPYAGYLHTDRPGKPSLVLDLVEEFRAPVVDRTILAYVNKGRPLTTAADGLFPAGVRQALAQAVFAQLDRRHPYRGQSLRLESIVQRQARAIAAFVRNPTVGYEPFAFRW